MKSLSAKIIATYLAIYYFFPLIVGYFYKYEYMDFLSGDPSYLLSGSFLIVFSLLLWTIFYFSNFFKSPINSFRFSIFDCQYINLLFSISYIACSYIYMRSFGLSFRQSGPRISESSSVVIVMMFFQAYFVALTLLYMSRLSFKYKFNSIEKVTTFISFLAFVLSIGSAYDVFKTFCVFLVMLAMCTKHNFYYLKEKNTPTKLAVKIISGSGVVLLSFFVGVANKIGINQSLTYLTTLSFENFIILPLRRISYHLYTLTYHLNYSLFDTELQTKGFGDIIDSFIFRALYLAGFHPAKPEVGGFSRLNSLRIYVENNAINGVSPGMVGSFFFFPYFPANLILWSIFLVFIAEKISDLFNKKATMSLIGIIYLLMVFQSIVDSSLEFLNPISKPGLALIFLFLAWLARPAQYR